MRRGCAGTRCGRSTRITGTFSTPTAPTGWNPGLQSRSCCRCSATPAIPRAWALLDAYAIPLRAYASSIQDFGDRLEIHADVEQVSRFQRSYEIARVSLGSAAVDANDHNQPECGYVIVAPNGEVARAGSASFGSDARYALPLTALRDPGVYTIMIALYVGGNDVNPEVKVVEHRVVAASAPAPTRHSGSTP